MAIVAAAIGAAGALGGAYLSSQGGRGGNSGGGNSMTSTGTQQQILLPETQASINELQRSSRVYADQQYMPYTGTRVADFTPDQLAAMGLTGDIADTSGALYGLGQDIVGNNLNNSGVDTSRALAGYASGFVPGTAQLAESMVPLASTSGGLAQYGVGLAGQGIDATTGLAMTMPNTDLSGYMNPYTRAALEPALRDMYERSAQQRNELNARAARTGSFGGSRNAISEAELERGTEREAGRLTATELANSFDKGVAQWRQDQNMIPQLYRNAQGMLSTSQDQQRSGIDALTAAVNGRTAAVDQTLKAQGALQNVNNLQAADLAQLGALSSMNANRLQTEVTPLYTSGGLQQAQNQSIYDTDYGNYIEERDWGARGLQQLQAAVGSGISGAGASTASSQTTPLGGNRTAQTIGGALMGSQLLGGRTGQQLASGLSSLWGGSGGKSGSYAWDGSGGGGAISDAGYADLYNSGGIDYSYGPQM